MKLTKTQRAAVELLQARLDPTSPLFAGSRTVERALTGEAKVYFQTWVLPLLRYLSDGEAWYGQGIDIVAERAHLSAAAKARVRAIEMGIEQ